MDAIQINIAEPCHENWQNMSDTEKGRYCSSCKKEVIDFTVMSDNEVFKTMMKSNNDLCGRFFNTQLDTTIKYETEKRQHWHKYFFSLFIPAFLFSKQSSAQKKLGKIACTKPVNRTMVTTGFAMPIITSANIKNIPPVSIEELLGKNDLPKTFKEEVVVVAGGATKRIIGDKEFELSGFVIDSNTRQEISASVVVKNNRSGTNTDSVGNFKLTGRAKDNIISLVVSAIGYETREMSISIPINGFKMSDIVFYLKPYAKQLDTVVVSSYPTQKSCSVMGGMSYRTSITRKPSTITQIVTKLTDSLKVYPNPVNRGNVINVDLKLKANENYVLQIMDISGKVVFQKQIRPIIKMHHEEVQTDNRWSSGMYIIKVINSENKLISVSRFVVA